jgi:hypothetical protein
MSRLEKGNPAPRFGRVEDAISWEFFPRPTTDTRGGFTAEASLKSLQDKWPAEFRDGARCGFLQRRDSLYGPCGYPAGFAHWQLERRNAWFAGFNIGYHDRSRLSKAVAA